MTTEGDAPAEEGAPPEVAASEPVEETTEETNPGETVVEEPETTAETTEEAPPEPEQEASTSKPAVMMDEAEIARKLKSGDKDDRVAARRALGSTKLRIPPEFRAHVHARQTVDIFSVRAIVHQSSARHRRVIVRLRASRPSVSLRARRKTMKDLESPRLVRTSAYADRTEGSIEPVRLLHPFAVVHRFTPSRVASSNLPLGVTFENSPRLSARCRQCTSPPTSPTERSRGR